MKNRPQLNHLGLYTPRIKAMEDFYTEVLGLVVTDRGRVARLGNIEIVFMSADPKSHHQLALIGKPEHNAPSCIHQIAFKVPSLADLRLAHDRLHDFATGAIQPIDHGNAWSIYGFDPDGNGIEVYLDTPWQVAQPHSRLLDFKLSDDEIRDNTEKAVRADPTFKLASEWSKAMEAAL